MKNSKRYFKVFAIAIVLLGIQPVFAQQTDTKTIDKFNELNQLLPKEQSSSPWVQQQSNKVVPDVRYLYTSSLVVNTMPASFKDAKVKVYVNGKETLVNFPYLGKPYATTMPARISYFSMPSKSGATYSFTQPRLDKMPLMKPNMDNYNMPAAKPNMNNFNMPVAQPGLKKPNRVLLIDTIGKQ